MNRILRIALPAAALAVALLAACTGDDREAGVGNAGSGGFSVGRIDGFASTLVEGQRLDDSRARVTVDEDPRAATPQSLAKLALGAQSTVEIADGAIRSSVVAAEVVGQVLGIDRANRVLTVNQQRVLWDALPALPTVLDGFTDDTFFSIGGYVEVHGERRANGDVIATRIERRSPDTRTSRLSGTLRALDAAARQFRIGDAVIDFSGATLLPAGAALANGQRVTVFSSSANDIGRAVTVRTETPRLPADVQVRLAGFIGGFRSAAEFRLRGVAVDASAARISGGALADLADDRLVRVRGTVANGVLRASELQLVTSAADAPIDVIGQVTDFTTSDAAFRLRGTTVKAAAARFAAGGVENLGNGVRLRVQGTIAGGDLVAQQLEVLADSPVRAGRISELVGASFRLAPEPRPITLAAGAVIRNGVLADVANGRRVRVTLADGAASALVATEVVLLDNPAAPLPVVVSGIVCELGVNLWLVNDTVFSADGSTQVLGGTLAEVRNGTYAVVEGLRQGDGSIAARRIELRRDLNASAAVLGYVSELSAGGFRVGGQRVSTGGATEFVGGSAASLRNLAYVEVEGSMVDGVLAARRVVFRSN